MTFADIPNGGSIFFDANTLFYHFTADPNYGSACTDLINRIERNEVSGFVSTHVLSDTSHRLMTIEAMLLHGWPLTGIASRLRRHRSEIGKFHRFRQAVDDVPKLGIQVLSIIPAFVPAACAISQRF